MNIDTVLTERFKAATENAERMLLPLDTVTDRGMHTILGRYTAIIEPNFVSWMAAAMIFARSQDARYTAIENLEVEIGDNHAGTLRDFSRAARAYPEQEHQIWMDEQLHIVRSMNAQGNGLQNTAWIAYLENTSTAFIPYLAEIAQRRGSNELEYTNVHGAADIGHAEASLYAIDKEMREGYKNPMNTIDYVITRGHRFLERIFVTNVERK